eukprot:TRINITY_DN7903_c0_g1_i4.p1 TRINITY_DN7903_c0_g1~~TRINITY_DN7903_c0_g1_i4.p1  ORF type:complete len:179 (-),score=18.24 TRINITY_DN7903_c0_g1_i4:748-1284(-)
MLCSRKLFCCVQRSGIVTLIMDTSQSPSTPPLPPPLEMSFSEVARYFVRCFSKPFLRKLHYAWQPLPASFSFTLPHTFFFYLFGSYTIELNAVVLEGLGLAVQRHNFERGGYAVIHLPLKVQCDQEKEVVSVEVTYAVFNDAGILQWPHNWEKKSLKHLEAQSKKLMLLLPSGSGRVL